MRRLSEWEFLVSNAWAEEHFTASCMFGSIHLKEFVFLTCFLDGKSSSRKCSRDRQHVRIEGKWTKPSVDELAATLADAFHRALRKKLCTDRWLNEKKGGLENPLCNDVLLSQRWEMVSSWRWTTAHKHPRDFCGGDFVQEASSNISEHPTSFCS